MRARKRLQPAAIPLLRPLVGTDQRTRDLQRFVVAFDNKHTRQIESQLRALRAPTLIVWGTDDVYFPVKWAHGLAETIPGAKPPVELEGAHLLSGGAGRGIQPAAARSPARRINRLRSEQGAFAG
jgi:pimeloyl-ACP methyl ester carboxylesterase